MSGIMREALLSWALNDTPQAPLLCSAGEEEALLLGHMVASGLVDDADKVRSIRREGDGWQVRAELCAQASLPALRRLEALKPLDGGFVAPSAAIVRRCEQAMAAERGAGLHTVLLGIGERTALGRDIGRHNALEKAVGSALRESLDLGHAILAASSRLSLEMLAKAAFAGIPILVTQKQVGSLCVLHAQRLNIAVCRLEAALRPLSCPERVRDE